MIPGRRRLTFVTWVVLVGLITYGLHLAGQGQLSSPPLRHPAAWAGWVAVREPVVAAVALLRLAALAAAWYLLGVSVVGGGLRLARAGRLVELTDRVTVPAVRRLLVATAGVTLASGLVPVAVSAHDLRPATVPTTAPQPVTTTAGPSLTMHLLAPGPGPPPAPEPAAPGPRPAPAPVVGVPSATWTVRAGECFWSIAEDVLARAWGRAPSDAEIVPYWRVLIEQNRHLLADRANPNLIFSGQVFSLPTPPAQAA